MKISKVYNIDLQRYLDDKIRQAFCFNIRFYFLRINSVEELNFSGIDSEKIGNPSIPNFIRKTLVIYYREKF